MDAAEHGSALPAFALFFFPYHRHDAGSPGEAGVGGTLSRMDAAT
jgi:hypothetical protein